ncbi:MAG: hypothetical protein GOP50_06805, partial [Candidatus Heimdallarchaeota archaeon]|nr:hypothetical protein [Candidatus Heimdallarchaeota archaeon]
MISKIFAILLILLFIQTSIPISGVQVLEKNGDVSSIEPYLNFGTEENYFYGTSKLDNYPEISPLQFDYNPILDVSGSGDDFTIDDTLQVYHSDNVSLNSDNSLTESYTITSISGYSADNLQYNITSITTSKEFNTQQTIHNKDEVLASDKIRIAQSFDVSYDYAVFSGAKIYL